MHYPGQVVVGGDRALSDNSLTVHGNIAMTGQITRPSDRRLKEDIEPVRFCVVLLKKISHFNLGSNK